MPFVSGANATLRVFSVSASATRLADIPFGVNQAQAVAVDPSVNKAFVDFWDGTLSVVDTINNLVIAHQTAVWRAGGMAVNPTNHSLYVTNTLSNNVYVYNTTANWLASVPSTSVVNVGASPMQTAVDSGSGRAYVINSGSSLVTVLNSDNTVLETLQLPGEPTDVAIDQVNHRAFFPDGFSGKVYVVSPS